MFYECTSLSSLPDISKWNTSSVIEIHNMLIGCSSLSSLPDISKWNTNDVTDMSEMFDEHFNKVFFSPISAMLY